MVNPKIGEYIAREERKKEKLVPLVAHARRELELIGEDPYLIEWYLSVVKKFSEIKHSGESSEHTTQVLERLLRFKHLGPLTDNPQEWEDISDIAGGVMWQSKRNPECFSIDEGKSYKVFSEHNDLFHATASYQKDDNEN